MSKQTKARTTTTTIVTRRDQMAKAPKQPKQAKPTNGEKKPRKAPKPREKDALDVRAVRVNFKMYGMNGIQALYDTYGKGLRKPLYAFAHEMAEGDALRDQLLQAAKTLFPRQAGRGRGVGNAIKSTKKGQAVIALAGLVPAGEYVSIERITLPDGRPAIVLTAYVPAAAEVPQPTQNAPAWAA